MAIEYHKPTNREIAYAAGMGIAVDFDLRRTRTVGRSSDCVDTLCHCCEYRNKNATRQNQQLGKLIVESCSDCNASVSELSNELQTTQPGDTTMFRRTRFHDCVLALILAYTCCVGVGAAYARTAYDAALGVVSH